VTVITKVIANENIFYQEMLIRLEILINIMSTVSRWEYTQDPNSQIPDLNNKTMTDIAGEWLKYFFNVQAQDHPHSHHDFTFDRGRSLDAHQKNYQNGQPSSAVRVWYLLEGNISGFYKTSLPDSQQWPIMYSQYVTFSSKAEFPSSLNAEDLKNLVANDTNAAYRLESVVNSERLMPVEISGSVQLNITGNNVLGIPPSANETVFFAGFFTLLKPLPPGDHLIESKGFSPNYENDVRYSVYVRK
jgi:hypothetical protein